MSRVSYVDIVSGLESNYWANITPQDRFIFSRVTRKTALLSIKRKKGLTQKSLLPQIAEDWANLGSGIPAIYGDAIFGDVFYGDDVGVGYKNNWMKLYNFKFTSGGLNMQLPNQRLMQQRRYSITT
jgi:hypothetical protein